MSSPLLLCIDCGGTKAAAVVSDSSGRVLGRGVGGAANFKDVERSAFLNSLKAATENALNAIDRSALAPQLAQALVLAASPQITARVAKPGSSPTNASLHSRQRSGLSATLSGWIKRSSSSSSGSSTPLSRSAIPLPAKSAVAGQSPSARISLPTREPLFAAIWLGCAGVDRPQDISDLTPLLSDLFSIPRPAASPTSSNAAAKSPSVPFTPRLIIDNDTALLASPLHQYAPRISTAVVAIAGTGCIVVSFKERASNGALEPLGRAGGWGWLLGDEGSGFYIGREALRRILDGADYESVARVGAGSEPPVTHPKNLISTSPTVVGRMVVSADIRSALEDEGHSPSSSLSSTSALSSPTSSSRTTGQLPSSTTSTSSLAGASEPHGISKIESSSSATSASSAPPPTLQERIFAHFGITQAADIFTVVYAPDPPPPAPSPPLPSSLTSLSSSLSSRPSSAQRGRTAGGSAHSSSSSSTVIPIGREYINGNGATASAAVNGTGGLPTRSSSSGRLSPALRTFKLASPYPSSTTPKRLAPKRRPSTAPNDSSPSSISSAGSGLKYASMERKARMTALTPIVFHSAFVDHDPLALDILQNASAAVARLIARNLAPLPSSPQASVSLEGSSSGGSGESFDPPMPVAASSVLCLGGSLVGVQAYRALVLEHLRRMGHVFPHVEYVKDAAEAGAMRLAAMFGKETVGSAGEDVAKMAKGNGNDVGFEAARVSA